MRQLIERHGGVPLVAPSMQEVPLDDNTEAIDAIRQIVAGRVDAIVLLTGVGTDTMIELARTSGLEDGLLESLSGVPIVVRGPKPAAVVHRLNLNVFARAAQPNTWSELIAAIDGSELDLNGKTVAVQEYGVASPELTAALEQRGARVLAVPVYRWALPDDRQPLEDAIRATVAGATDMTLFTSAQQVHHVLQVAEELGLREDWQKSAPRIASIGPTCSETIRNAGMTVWFEADPSKMGTLARGALELYGSE